MIELRWLSRAVGRDAQGFYLFERTLQYRVDISAGQGVHYVNKDDRMSPWQDVPEVAAPGGDNGSAK